MQSRLTETEKETQDFHAHQSQVLKKVFGGAFDTPLVKRTGAQKAALEASEPPKEPKVD